MPHAETALSVRDVSERLGVCDETVLAHIRAGRLVAVNVGLGSQRPRWRIRPEALDQFLAARTAIPQQPATRSRKRELAGAIEYF